MINMNSIVGSIPALFVCLCISAPAFGASCIGRGQYSAPGDATCTAVSDGYYTTGCDSDGNNCTGQEICSGAVYCDGGVQKDCPPVDDQHVRTTFPDDYYNPTIISRGLRPHVGSSSISQCEALMWMKSARGELYEYARYNVSTNQYDRTSKYGWHAIIAGYYLSKPRTCGDYAYYLTVNECPAGSYCPGKASVICNADNQATVHTETFGLEPCPAGTYSASGASECQPCTNAPNNAGYIGNATTNSCPWACDDGYGNHGGKCVPLCSAGVRYIRADNGLRINLYQTPYSSPRIAVEYNNAVCYGILAPGGAKNSININYNGQIYHTTN